MKIKLLWILVCLILPAGTAAAQVSFPPELMTEFGQYPHSTVEHTMSAAGMVQAILNCGKTPPNTVFDHYKKKAMSSGWEISMEMKSPDMTQLWLAKDQLQGMIAITAEDGVTSVVLSIMR